MAGPRSPGSSASPASSDVADRSSVADVYIVGAGRVGTGLALALRDAGVPLTGIYNRGAPGRRRASELLGLRADANLGNEALRRAAVVLVCVSDDAIADVGADLAASELRPDAVVAHTSGCAAGEHLAARAPTGLPAARGSLHPLVACPDPETAARALRGALYAVEGEPAAVTQLTSLARMLEGRVVELAAADKPRYHAAAVLASNLVVALLASAVDEARAVGLDDPESALVDLAAGALERAKELGLRDALTGPVARGDAATVRAHLAVLPEASADLYRRLSERALALAEERGLSEERLRATAEALTER